jgi:SPP1 gp7 family putative phage head morphogenesis protein
MSEQDPTRTKTLRKEFGAEFYKRFRRVKGHVRESIEDKDVLSLGSQRVQNDAPDPSSFKFLTDPEKRERFQAWLEKKVAEEVLVVEDRDVVRNGEHYTAEYIRKAYQKGVENATSELNKNDVDAEELENVFNKPIHAEKAEILYLRTYDNLVGITEAMDTQISRELSNAITQGWNPRKAARSINDRVDKIGLTRARTLAQTEIIHAHAEGTLDRYESAGVEEVEVRIEVASDGRQCVQCERLRGNVYTIEEARGMIPLHPRCRCTFSPVID